MGARAGVVAGFGLSEPFVNEGSVSDAGVAPASALVGFGGEGGTGRP